MAAISKVLSPAWQRCRVHFRRNVLAYAGKIERGVVSVLIATAIAQDTAEAASAQLHPVIKPNVRSSPRSWTRPDTTFSPT